jgi:hypothetical protein
MFFGLNGFGQHIKQITIEKDTTIQIAKYCLANSYNDTVDIPDTVKSFFRSIMIDSTSQLH